MINAEPKASARFLAVDVSDDTIYVGTQSAVAEVYAAAQPATLDVRLFGSSPSIRASSGHPTRLFRISPTYFHTTGSEAIALSSFAICVSAYNSHTDFM